MNNNFEENKEFIKTLSEGVKQFMLQNEWVTNTQIADAVEHLFNGSSVTAAYRSLRQKGYTVLKRRNEDVNAFEKYQYKLVKGKTTSGKGIFKFLPDTDENRQMEARYDLMYKLNHEIYEEN
jgi:hypothetical protein